MAGLLVAIGIMGVLMSVAMPSWRTVVKREKEAELLFRGEQYMRAIDLYQRRFPGAYPTDLEMLVEQRFLRRAYLDPMTGEPFRILTQGSAAAALGETTFSDETDEDGRRNRLSDRTGRASFGTTFGSGASGLGRRSDNTFASPFSRSPGAPDDELGGIVGVVSRSSEESLLEYNGATRYDQWLYRPRAAGGRARRPGRAGSGGAWRHRRPPGRSRRHRRRGGTVRCRRSLPTADRRRFRRRSRPGPGTQPDARPIVQYPVPMARDMSHVPHPLTSTSPRARPCRSPPEPVQKLTRSPPVCRSPPRPARASSTLLMIGPYRSTHSASSSTSPGGEKARGHPGTRLAAEDLLPAQSRHDQPPICTFGRHYHGSPADDARGPVVTRAPSPRRAAPSCWRCFSAGAGGA